MEKLSSTYTRTTAEVSPLLQLGFALTFVFYGAHCAPLHNLMLFKYLTCQEERPRDKLGQ